MVGLTLPALATTPSASASATPGLYVPANVGTGVDSGVDVQSGQYIYGEATGTATYGYDTYGCTGTVTTDASGNRSVGTTSCSPLLKIDPSAPDPTDPLGALIARVGSGPWFMLGASFSKQMPSTGRLYLAYNDSSPSDNTGGYNLSLFLPATMPANEGAAGHPTGVNVHAGEVVTFSAQGSATYGYEGQPGCTGIPNTDPDGNRTLGGTMQTSMAPQPCTPLQKTPGAPFAGAPVGALIGKVGSSGSWFLIGRGATVTMPTDGQILLGYNDDAPADNTGSYHVTITPGAFTAPTPSSPPPPPAPSAPLLSLSATAPTWVSLVWTQSNLTNVTYTVAWAPAGTTNFSFQDVGTSTGVTSNTLTPSTSWTFFVRACATTCSDWSNAITATTDPLPAPSSTVAYKAPGAAPTVKLVGLEVNQAVQDWHNSVPLVSGKTAVVRVFAQLANPGSMQVSAVLHGYRNGQELSDSPLTAPLNDGGSITVTDAFPDRSQLGSSLNFELPDSWTNQAANADHADMGDLSLKAEMVGGSFECHDAAYPTPNDCATTVTFGPYRQVNLEMVGLSRTSADGQTVTPPPPSADLTAIAVSNLDPSPAGSLSWVNKHFPTETATFKDGVSDLAAVNTLIDKARYDEGCSDPCPRVYIGVIAGNVAGGIAGLTDAIPGNALTVFDGSGQYRNTVTHELFHAFGEEHDVTGSVLGSSSSGLPKGYCGALGDPGTPDSPYTWKTPAGKTVYPLGPLDQGADNEMWGLSTSKLTSGDALAVVDPHKVFALMSYCAPVDRTGQDEWPSGSTYSELYYNGVVPKGMPRPSSATVLGTSVSGAASAAASVMVVRGSVDLATHAVTFAPFETAVVPSAPPAPPTGPYTLELRDATGQVVTSVPFTPGIQEAVTAPLGAPSAPTTASFLFPVAVANPAAVAAADVVNAGSVVGLVNAPGQAPSVTVGAPTAGAQVSGDSLTVAWTATGASPLTASVRYSPDNGTTWKALAEDMTGSSLTVSRNELPGSNGANALVRVVVSDGFHSASADSAPFSLVAGPPSITLISPLPGLTTPTLLSGGQALDLRALTTTADAGPVTITWSSDLDGPLGHGTHLTLATMGLHEGTHTITATATSSTGHLTATTTAQVTIIHHAVAVPAEPTTVPTTGPLVPRTMGVVPVNGGGTPTMFVSSGGIAYSDGQGTAPSPSAPVVASLTSPVSGWVGFTRIPVSPSSPGVVGLPFGMAISAPVASATAPLTLSFTIDPSSLPHGISPGEVIVERDGSVIADCAAGTPVPCISQRSFGGAGALIIAVQTEHASTWTFGYARTSRISGATREATAVAVSQAQFPAKSARAVVIATSRNFPDGLAGATLAAARQAPLLLTPPGQLDPGVAAEVVRVLEPGSPVIVLGGPAAVGDGVVTQLTSMGYQVSRIAGPDRAATAVAIAEAVSPQPTAVMITTGADFADALSAGPAAIANGAVVVLSDGSSQAAATAAYLQRHAGAPLFAIGGPAAVATPSATAIVGTDRYQTSTLVAQRFFSRAVLAGIASGVDYPDALSAGARLGTLGAPVLLSAPAMLPGVVGSYITSQQASLSRVEVFGGTSALDPSVQAAAGALFG